MIVGTHYAHKFPSVSYIWALMDGDEIEGAVTFGRPSSAPLRRGVAGDDFAPFVWELNRLVLRHNHRNDASRLVSRALRQMGDAIIVSFADPSHGHLGIVYQAAAFGYYGLSAKRTDWKVRGREHIHGQTIADEFRGQPNRAALMREKYGDNFYLAPRPRKHRYIRVVGSKSFRRAAGSAIRYTQQPWPQHVQHNGGDV